MAAAQVCDQHPDQPAVVIIHNLDTADFAGLCLECLLGYAVAALQQFAPDQLAPPPAKRTRAKRAPAAAAVADDQAGGESDGSPIAEGARAAESNGIPAGIPRDAANAG